MTKAELIEKIQDLKENLENYQSIAYLDIADEIRGESDKHNQIAAKLEDADSYLDQCLDLLEEAIEIAEELSEYEYTTTYAKMAQRIANKVLCNRITEIDEDFSAVSPDRMSNDGEPIGEVMQYYLTDCSTGDVDFLCENYDRVYFSYSTKLDLWVLLVDHWGSSWDIVEIGTHNEYDKIDR